MVALASRCQEPVLPVARERLEPTAQATDVAHGCRNASETFDRHQKHFHHSPRSRLLMCTQRSEVRCGEYSCGWNATADAGMTRFRLSSQAAKFLEIQD